MYWSAEGKPITAKEFVERMFDDLPQFFDNEDQLREIWSNPSTREKLLQELSDAGYDHEKLDGMKQLIDADDSDVYDVLRYVAFASETVSRKERVKTAHPNIEAAFHDDKQQAFIDFILDKYVEEGVTQLALEKEHFSKLLQLKYGSTPDAIAVLGSPSVIRETYVDFQKYLYE